MPLTLGLLLLLAGAVVTAVAFALLRSAVPAADAVAGRLAGLALLATAAVAPIGWSEDSASCPPSPNDFRPKCRFSENFRWSLTLFYPAPTVIDRDG